ncbi:MAG: hypothetical protein Q9186_001046 [Xanthomendoza sp. 1 TL-2023]
MKTARSVATSASLRPDTYIYHILPVNTKLVSISSDDSLRVIDPHTLNLNESIHGIHDGLSCLGSYRDQDVLTAGRDGLVKCIDLRSQDRRVHLSEGSTDGLANLYDTTITDEDDALTQVFNHGSSIAHAGFLSDHDVFALSHDEIFSIYSITDSVQDDASKSIHAFGDLRPQLQCEYIVDLGDTIFTGGENGLIRAWRSSEDAPNPPSPNKAEYPLHTDKKRKKHDSSHEDKRSRFNPY